MAQSRILLRTRIRSDLSTPETQEEYEARRVQMIEWAKEEWTTYLPQDRQPTFSESVDRQEQDGSDVREVQVTW